MVGEYVILKAMMLMAIWNFIMDTSAQPTYESKTYRGPIFFWDFDIHLWLHDKLIELYMDIIQISKRRLLMMKNEIIYL